MEVEAEAPRRPATHAPQALQSSPPAANRGWR